jgi:hypothetical protein
MTCLIHVFYDTPALMTASTKSQELSQTCPMLAKRHRISWPSAGSERVLEFEFNMQRRNADINCKGYEIKRWYSNLKYFLLPRHLPDKTEKNQEPSTKKQSLTTRAQGQYEVQYIPKLTL